MFFSISLHVPGPTLWVSHFARFSMILAIFQVLPYEFLIFLVSQFSQHIPGPRVCMPHFPRFFQLSDHTQGPKVYVPHFSRFSVFYAIFHVLQFVVLIFHDFHFSFHTPGSTVCISHFPLF